jgi:hypothetical protein
MKRKKNYCGELAIHCVAGTAASIGTSVRNIDTGKQHGNNAHWLHYVYLFSESVENEGSDDFILEIFKLSRINNVEICCQQNNVWKHLKNRIIGFQYNYIQMPLHTNTENSHTLASLRISFFLKKYYSTKLNL